MTDKNVPNITGLKHDKQMKKCFSKHPVTQLVLWLVLFIWIVQCSMFFLKLVLVQAVSYGLFRRNYSPGLESPDSKQYSLHDERGSVAPGEVLYVKPVPILQNFGLFDEHNSDSEVYSPATYHV